MPDGHTCKKPSAHYKSDSLLPAQCWFCKCNYNFISQIQKLSQNKKNKKVKKSRNLIQHKAWTNLEKHILNSNQTLIIFLPLQKVNQEKYFKIPKLLSSKWHFISIPRCPGKQPSLPLTTVPVRAEWWSWQWSPSVWKACWSLLPGLPVLWGGGKERGRMHRLQKRASWEG